MSKSVVLANVPQTSQDIGKTVHNTVAHAHTKSHAIAEEIARKHDRHSFDQDLGHKVTNTAWTGEDRDLHDGRDEQEPVEKTVLESQRK